MSRVTLSGSVHVIIIMSARLECFVECYMGNCGQYWYRIISWHGDAFKGWAGFVMHGMGRQPYPGSPSLKFNSRKLTVLQLKRNITVSLINVDKLPSQPNLDRASLDFAETSFVMECTVWLESGSRCVQLLVVNRFVVKIYNGVKCSFNFFVLARLLLILDCDWSFVRDYIYINSVPLDNPSYRHFMIETRRILWFTKFEKSLLSYHEYAWCFFFFFKKKCQLISMQSLLIDDRCESLSFVVEQKRSIF